MATAKDSKAPRKPSSPTNGRTKQPNVITPKADTFVPITSPDDPRFPAALDFVNGFLEREAAAQAEREQKKQNPPQVVFSKEDAYQLGHRAAELGSMLGAVKRLSWLMEDDRDASHAAAIALEAISFVGALKADAIAHALGAIPCGGYDAEDFDRYARAAGYTKGGAK